jgi:hypothetical protein
VVASVPQKSYPSLRLASHRLSKIKEVTLSLAMMRKKRRKKTTVSMS